MYAPLPYLLAMGRCMTKANIMKGFACAYKLGFNGKQPFFGYYQVLFKMVTTTIYLNIKIKKYFISINILYKKKLF